MADAYTADEIAELRECYALRDWEEGAESPRWLATLDAERRAREEAEAAHDGAAEDCRQVEAQRDEARAAVDAWQERCHENDIKYARWQSERDRALALLRQGEFKVDVLQEVSALLEGVDRD